jgi:hypothetical protein
VDVTAAMQSFRECARHIWNAHFHIEAKRRQDWDLHEQFEEAALILFRALVLHGRDVGDPEALANYRGGPAPLMCLRLDVAGTSEILVNRTGTSGYWDDPVTRIEPGDLDLRFIWFFDWSDLDFRDFQYCRVRIVASARHPHLVGRDALLPVTDNVRMFCEPIP